MDKLGSASKDVTVIFNDTPAENWFAAGEPMQSQRKT
ncbi:tautomerase family protein [Mesorhizobium sp.]|nr:tautomerase family protein [Mesorhizobium sp.]